MNSTNGFTQHSIQQESRRFDSITRSALKSNSKSWYETVLPEANYFADRRVQLDFDRHSVDDEGKRVEKAFGFDIGDETDLERVNKIISLNKTVNTSSLSKSASTLSEIRATLKRFLHSSGANSHLNASEHPKIGCEAANNHQNHREISIWKEKSILFLDLGEDVKKQKDIRSAFAGQPYYSIDDEAIPSTSKQNLPVFQFEETENVRYRIYDNFRSNFLLLQHSLHCIL